MLNIRLVFCNLVIKYFPHSRFTRGDLKLEFFICYFMFLIKVIMNI